MFTSSCFCPSEPVCFKYVLSLFYDMREHLEGGEAGTIQDLFLKVMKNFVYAFCLCFGCE